MHLLLCLLGLLVWAVFSCLDDITKQQSLKRHFVSLRPSGAATEYRIGHEKYAQYVAQWTEIEHKNGNIKEKIKASDLSDETWSIIESEIWNEVRAFPEVESDYRRRGFCKNDLVKAWSAAYAANRVVKMGMNPWTYAPSGYNMKAAPVGVDYMCGACPVMMDPEQWNEHRYKLLSEAETVSAEILAEKMKRV